MTSRTSTNRFRSLASILAFGALAACASSRAPVTDIPAPGDDPTPSGQEPKRASEPDPRDCGWREASSSCEADSDCAPGSVCVEGLGKTIVPEPQNGVAPMPPYERERVKFCEPKGCPQPEAVPAEEGPAAPEPAP